MKIFADVFNLDKDVHWGRSHAPRLAPQALRPAQKQQIQTALDARKLVVTARDPYLSAIRWISLTSNTVQDMYYAWNYFFDVLDKKEYFIVDIGCREQDRAQHICDLAQFINVEYDMERVEDFALAWKPEYSSNTSAKQSYLGSGNLPPAKTGTWSMLDDAVKWYANLKTNDK